MQLHAIYFSVELSAEFTNQEIYQTPMPHFNFFVAQRAFVRAIFHPQSYRPLVGADVFSFIGAH
jgi:hypothetical protein